MNRLRNEYRLFQSCPRNMRILLGTNLIYALTIPVVDIFVAAYVMRNSQDPKLVVTYQLAVYTGIPLSFLINGFLLRFVRIKRLYSAGMLLGGLAMVAMMSLGKLSLGGTGINRRLHGAVLRPVLGKSGFIGTILHNRCRSELLLWP